jgi:hypothetical protein
MSGRGVSRISASVPPDLLGNFGEVINRLGNAHSKVIQIAMRSTRYRINQSDPFYSKRCARREILHFSVLLIF